MKHAGGIINTVHVIDDDQDVVKAIDWTLRSVGYNVQVYSTARDFLDLAQPGDFGCLIVDLLLPGMTGLELCRQMVANEWRFEFVMISAHGEVSTAVEVMKLGAVDFLEKPCSRQRLLEAVHMGLDRVMRQQHDIREEDEVAGRLESLSCREREVFDAMAAGLVTKEIARELGISPKTVDVHRSKIADKLQIESPAQIGHLVYMLNRRSERLKRSAR
jgi:FixJ family two-component response regulator